MYADKQPQPILKNNVNPIRPTEWASRHDSQSLGFANLNDWLGDALIFVRWVCAWCSGPPEGVE